MQQVFQDIELKMKGAVDHLHQELKSVRTGRASLAILDGVSVDYYGAPTPLNQLANLSVADATLIVAQPFDPSTIGDIEKAISASGLGLNPSNDGKVIRIAIPPLTEERRKELVRHVKKLAEDHKVGVRDGRRAALGMLKDLEGEGLSQDERRRAEKQVQDLTDEFVGKIDDMAAQKEKEVLEV